MEPTPHISIEDELPNFHAHWDIGWRRAHGVHSCGGWPCYRGTICRACHRWSRCRGRLVCVWLIDLDVGGRRWRLGLEKGWSFPLSFASFGALVRDNHGPWKEQTLLSPLFGPCGPLHRTHAWANNSPWPSCLHHCNSNMFRRCWPHSRRWRCLPCRLGRHNPCPSVDEIDAPWAFGGWATFRCRETSRNGNWLAWRHLLAVVHRLEHVHHLFDVKIFEVQEPLHGKDYLGVTLGWRVGTSPPPFVCQCRRRRAWPGVQLLH